MATSNDDQTRGVYPPSAELISYSPDPLQLITMCGRTAYGSTDDGSLAAAEKWIRARIKGWELDVLEHATMTWRIMLSRISAQQYTRHRIAAYTMQSQRFRETPETDMDLLPPECKPEDAMEWIQDYHNAYKVYLKWRGRGYHKQAARYHLPLGSATILVPTWNFREMLHIFHMRKPNMAEPETQKLAHQMWEQAVALWPCVFENDIAA